MDLRGGAMGAVLLGGNGGGTFGGAMGAVLLGAMGAVLLGGGKIDVIPKNKNREDVKKRSAKKWGGQTIFRG